MAEVIGSLGGSVLGAMAQGKYNMDAQEDVQDFQRDMYKHRYQMQMADMERAGLNPMLSYSSGPPGPPSGTGGATIAAPDITGALSTAAQLKRVDSEVETQKTQQKLNTAQAMESVARADNLSQQTAESRTRVPNISAGTTKLQEETSKIKQETTSATAKAYQDTQDAAMRGLVGRKTWYTDAMESTARIASGLMKSLGLLNETPKRESQREEKQPEPAPQPQPRYKGRSGR